MGQRMQDRPSKGPGPAEYAAQRAHDAAVARRGPAHSIALPARPPRAGPGPGPAAYRPVDRAPEGPTMGARIEPYDPHRGKPGPAGYNLQAQWGGGGFTMAARPMEATPEPEPGLLFIDLNL